MIVFATKAVSGFKNEAIFVFTMDLFDPLRILHSACQKGIDKSDGE